MPGKCQHRMCWLRSEMRSPSPLPRADSATASACLSSGGTSHWTVLFSTADSTAALLGVGAAAGHRAVTRPTAGLALLPRPRGPAMSSGRKLPGTAPGAQAPTENPSQPAWDSTCLQALAAAEKGVCALLRPRRQGRKALPASGKLGVGGGAQKPNH